MPRLSGAFDESPIMLVGWPAEIAEQILRDENAEDRARENQVPKLRNMLAETGFIEIPVPGDEPLIVHYRRASMTPRRQARLMGAIGADGKPVVDAATLTAMCEIYADVIESWNLTDDEGNIIGTDAESLQDVDLATLNMVISAVGKEINPDPLSGSDSSNGSSRAGDLEPLRITTAS